MIPHEIETLFKKLEPVLRENSVPIDFIGFLGS